jgi:hypothetical protein
MKKYLFIIIVFALHCSAEPLPPKTLLFSPITPEYLQATAADWQATGFDGFLLSGIMSNWADDIWATDGDSLTRGADDKTFQRLKECNEVCRKAGIEDNFIKIAFYSHVPLWTDEAAWKSACRNFFEAARFARETGCRGIALDIEYVGEQYELDWEGYDYQTYSQCQLQTAAIGRGRELVQAMLEAFPEMVFLHLPEGITYYGPLASNLFSGMVQAMAKANAEGGMYLLTEASYDMTSTLGLIHYARTIESKVLDVLDKSSAEYWKKNGGIALGGWPLGYYRKILDEQGKFIGWSGKQEKFGNEIVGSYADKSSRFPVEEFRAQYAGLLLGSDRYCWIYGHGATWWHYSEEEARKFGDNKNARLPVDENLDGYKTVVREKWLSDEGVRLEAAGIKTRSAAEFIKYFNFFEEFMVDGPWGCKDCNNFQKKFPPEEKDLHTLSEKIEGSSGWKQVSVDPRTAYLDLKKYFSPADWHCAYAYCKVISPAEMSVQLRVGTNDMGALWLNGKQILFHNSERSAVLDDDILPVELQSGENTILIKVCNTEGNWGLYLRVTDDKGNAPAGLKFWPEGGKDNEL